MVGTHKFGLSGLGFLERVISQLPSCRPFTLRSLLLAYIRAWCRLILLLFIFYSSFDELVTALIISLHRIHVSAPADAPAQAPWWRRAARRQPRPQQGAWAVWNAEPLWLRGVKALGAQIERRPCPAYKRHRREQPHPGRLEKFRGPVWRSLLCSAHVAI